MSVLLGLSVYFEALPRSLSSQQPKYDQKHNPSTSQIITYRIIYVSYQQSFNIDQ